MLGQTIKTALITGAALASLVFTPASIASDNASNASHHTSQASKYSALTMGDSVVAGAAISTAVVAVPMVITGTVVLSGGMASIGVANAALDSKSSKPLPISDDVIIAGPPPSAKLEGE
ncbi:hypothetical protein [Pseudoalteromonas obscura]|uniref:Uncharacterized protein n=1 Tax=Pseudoalteromonas obscura TaxID=3048491 RepID=A0ABT7EMH4_9GAMM|nr:hypothetical protein [Pseudoalteromonas sp. P94(2023)]MDK2596250.1 hypothetical protein [Pseudoalteromonas sp. P94(2023)]